MMLERLRCPACGTIEISLNMSRSRFCRCRWPAYTVMLPADEPLRVVMRDG